MHLLKTSHIVMVTEGKLFVNRLYFSPGISRLLKLEYTRDIFCYKACLCCLNEFTRTEILIYL